MKRLCYYSLIFFTFIKAQSDEISGILFDRESQSPLFGVNIICGEIGATSNELGQFTILADAGQKVSFSFIGYETTNTTLRKNMIVFIL